MKNSNEKGFALVICIALLPVVIAGLLLSFSTFGFLQNDLALKYQCRTDGLESQKKIAPLLTNLLALNSLSRTLKFQYLAAVAELAAAIASENIPATIKAEHKINMILEKRQTLDKQQRQLISQSNLSLRTSYVSTANTLRNTGRNLSNLLLKTRFISMPRKAPSLAVHPDYADIAPTYSLDIDFEIKSALAHEWQYKTEIQPPFSNFLKGTFEFKKSCSVSLTKENAKWIPKIIKGKYSLKSLW
ncbi:MAG: hypothetical protein ACXVCP_10300 [Bdellovibrio sp.]